MDHWSPDLIEIEHAAKENSAILFYVIDNKTRNVVSDIETANFAGYRKNLVLVIHPQDAVAGSVVAGEQISSKEAQDIQEALTVLHEIAFHQGILVFDNISQAMSKVIQVSSFYLHKPDALLIGGCDFCSKILKDKSHQNNDAGEDNTVCR